MTAKDILTEEINKYFENVPWSARGDFEKARDFSPKFQVAIHAMNRYGDITKAAALDILHECVVQLKYLNAFEERGTTNSVISRAETFLELNDPW